jgi:diguanylate cyclase (GGDEF)-like protein
MIGLDDFKPLNDCHGHGTGDAVLRIVSARLVANLRVDDTVARLGGTDVDRVSLERLAARLIIGISRPCVIGGIEVTVGASVGITIGTGACCDVDELMQRADEAMSVAKARGRNGYALRVVGRRPG